ncbi:MAG: LuxR C-terminal-related transcriptional regulator [Chloroflexota bacterium]
MVELSAERAAGLPDRPARPAPPHNLPSQVTSFIGREAELAVAVELLGQARLVTVTGPGGTGKTRFAARVAARLLDQYDDGAFFVGLAPVFDPDVAVATIGQVMGVPDTRGRPPLESLKDFLREKQLLLVLDNFEQLLDAGPRLVEVLVACPAVRMLVTSRVVLRVTAEQELPLAPLSVPDVAGRVAAADLLAAVERSEAARLFVERARAIAPDFALTEQNAAVVAELCRRLDGLPLAIELAAARVRLFSPESMLARLAGRADRPAGARHGEGSASPPAARSSPLQFLTGGARDLPARQQTLRDTIGWSYDLLTPSEQGLFRRLAIFVGGCTLDAAEAVGTAGIGDRRWEMTADEVLDGVESLIAKSLVRRLDGPAGGSGRAAGRRVLPSTEPRYTMLETIREYGLERLQASGELLTLRRWHARHFLALAEQAEPGQRGHEQVAWLRRLDAEHDNLRAALEWGLADVTHDEVALRLSGALAAFWMCRGHVTEGRRWLGRALAEAAGSPAARLKAHHGAGRLAHFQRDSLEAWDQLRTARTLAEELGDTWALAWTLHLLGRVAYFDGDASTARQFAEQSLIAAREIGDDWLAGWAIHLLALAAHIDGDFATARACYEESLAVRRPLGHPEGSGIGLNLLGMLTYAEGDYAGALALIRESLVMLRDVGYYAIPTVLATATSIAARLGQHRRAARLAGATAAFSESVDIVPIPLAEGMLSEALALARRSLGDTTYEAAWLAGRTLSLDEAIDEALADDTAAGAAAPSAPVAVPVEERPPSDHDVPPAARSAGLTEREAAVLRSIAAGRTTREIAAELFVSVATVERHITNLYGKIGARGRADATAFAIQHGLGEGRE